MTRFFLFRLPENLKKRVGNKLPTLQKLAMTIKNDSLSTVVYFFQAAFSGSLKD
ncbi:MAG: hypothetical protein IKZ88_05695 [Neisseriaceae bacterium]|nr:hypothetical protein [Neisseriaceae bacterium]